MKYRIALFLVFSFIFCSAQTESDAEEAFRVSSETHKPILLVFAGSDWCAPCIRFERQVLSEKKFIDFAAENLIILKADFPQRRKLPEEEQRQNELLAEQYNAKGEFPRLMLLNNDRSVLSVLPYNNQSATEFISQIRNSLSK